MFLKSPNSFIILSFVLVQYIEILNLKKKNACNILISHSPFNILLLGIYTNNSNKKMHIPRDENKWNM